jgi:uracil-DNA glycosylase
MQFIAAERRETPVYPDEPDVFNAFRWSAFERTKVVILGQDPYHGDGQADGFAFSVRAGCRLPPSLKNIFAELKDDLGIDNGRRGKLTCWARQGVLLLNTVLTVRQAVANSHRNRGWEKFTDRVIEALGNRSEPIVFLLWGKAAAARATQIGSHHTVLIAPHPSPLSAYRGFLGSRPFSKANQALVDAGRQPIDWKIADPA